jgi:hypothetical protein
VGVALSTLHSNVAPASVEENVNVAVLEFDGLAGTGGSIDVSGATVSTVHDCEAGDGSVPNSPTART